MEVEHQSGRYPAEPQVCEQLRVVHARYAAANPEKEMLRLCSVRCPHMNQITLEDTLESLRKEQFEIFIDEDIRKRALRAVERMLEIGRED